MKKRIFSMLLVAVMLLAVLSGCGKKDTSGDKKDTAGGFNYRVGIVDMADSDENCYASVNTFKKTIESEEFKKAVGHEVSVEWVDSNNNISNQLSNVETLISKKVDAIFMLGFDAAGNSSAVQAANNAGIPIFLIATEAKEGDYKFVGFNEYDCGKVQGDYVAKSAKKGDKIFYLEGTAGFESVKLRGQGFMDGIKGRDDLKIVSTQSGKYSTETAMQVTEDWVQKYGDQINWIVTQDNGMAKGAVEVLKAANMLNKVRISSWIVPGTWDAQYIKNGEIEQSVYVSFVTLGETAAQVCQKFYKGENIDKRTYMSLYSVTKDNYSEYFK